MNRQAGKNRQPEDSRARTINNEKNRKRSVVSHYFYTDTLRIEHAY